MWLIKKRIILFIVLLVFTAGWVHGAISAQERAALIAFYQSTNGDSWYDSSNWKGNNNEPDGFSQIGSEDTWYGIVVEDDKVVGIDILFNYLTGSLPAEIGNLPNLRYLRLPENDVGGSLPPELGNLTQLEELNLYSNYSISGSIPPQLGNLSNLKELNLFRNNFSGSIPPELGNLTNLELLRLRVNSLTGSIPSQLGNLTNLKNLDLGYNALSSSIPPELGNLANLEALSLDSNDLTGSIPAELGNLSNLQYFDIHSNYTLSGSIPPELGNLSNLGSLDLRFNNLSGRIPSQLGNLSSLQSLRLECNTLSGSIPTSLTNLASLYTLRIDHNALYTDDETLRVFLANLQPSWENSQTVAPTNVAAVPTSPSKVKISWTPIMFTLYTGGYRVFYSTTSGGSWTEAGTTATKTDSEYEVTGLTFGQTYYFVVQTWTNYCSEVSSEYSSEVSAVINVNPVIAFNRSELYFGAALGSTPPPSQTFVVISSGTGTANWTASSDSGWLAINPTSGTAGTVVTVSVDPSGLSAGTYTGSIQVTDPTATNSPQAVTVYLEVKKASQDQPPFGSFETPVHGSTVRSSIPVTGWALDDTGVQDVKIYRDPVSGESQGLVYIGDAIMVEGARPDVEQAYPTYPNSYEAGWGYMLLTNFLPDGGNGTFTIYAVASDLSGHQTTLGTKTITCDNANAEKPFGAIDTPQSGGIASGTSYDNWGWALTPLPNRIIKGFTAITVWIDGVDVGNPYYGYYREDIATLFPGYANSNSANAVFTFDTTPYENGLHTISWTVRDSDGNTDGIGSRYFSIWNSSGSRVQRASSQGAGSMEQGAWSREKRVACLEPVGIIKGYARGMEPQAVYPNDNGIINIEITQLERLEIHLSAGFVPEAAGVLAPPSIWTAYHVVGDELRPLPIGSTFDPINGVLYWQPGSASIGDYRFMLIEKNQYGEKNKFLNIKISPKSPIDIEK